MIGGFCERYSAGWSDDEITWYETLLDEQDADIMAWAIGKQEVPQAFRGPMMEAMQRLDAIGVRR